MRSLQKLAGHFLDVVAGLPTLKVFGRAKAQARSIAEVTDRYRSATMATLRLTFLSSLILELLATVSVALVAVAVGLRLLGGHMSFADALFVLVLAPEAYLPLRALGANYHASADGMKAAEEIFELLEAPGGDRPAGPAGPGTSHPDRRTRCHLPGRPLPALQRRRPRRRAGRDGRADRTQRVRQVHAALASSSDCVSPAPGRSARRRRPRRPRPRRLAPPHRLGATATAPLRPLGRRQRPSSAGPVPPTPRSRPRSRPPG